MTGATGIVMWRWNDTLAVANTSDSHGYVISYNPTNDSIECCWKDGLTNPI
jgi:hypothetical protein